MNLIKQGIAIEDVKYLKDGEEKYNNMLEFLSYIDLYSSVITAKEIGVVFHIDDFTRKELKIFSVIHNELNKIKA